MPLAAHSEPPTNPRLTGRLQIRPFLPADQKQVRQIIQEGLAEHFPDFDPALNPDLHDIEQNYLDRGYLFIVAQIHEDIVGTGALISETGDIGRIVRVSVAKSYRRLGIGRLITAHLIQAAPRFRYHSIVVETNDDWLAAIRLYQSFGFKEVDHRNGEIHMMLQLSR